MTGDQPQLEHQSELIDRACLATAIIRRCSVVTADHAWSRLDLGVEIEVIR